MSTNIGGKPISSSIFTTVLKEADENDSAHAGYADGTTQKSELEEYRHKLEVDLRTAQGDDKTLKLKKKAALDLMLNNYDIFAGATGEYEEDKKTISKADIGALSGSKNEIGAANLTPKAKTFSFGATYASGQLMQADGSIDGKQDGVITREELEEARYYREKDLRKTDAEIKAEGYLTGDEQIKGWRERAQQELDLVNSTLENFDKIAASDGNTNGISEEDLGKLVSKDGDATNLTVKDFAKITSSGKTSTTTAPPANDDLKTFLEILPLADQERRLSDGQTECGQDGKLSKDELDWHIESLKTQLESAKTDAEKQKIQKQLTATENLKKNFDKIRAADASDITETDVRKFTEKQSASTKPKPGRGCTTEEATPSRTPSRRGGQKTALRFSYDQLAALFDRLMMIMAQLGGVRG